LTRSPSNTTFLRTQSKGHAKLSTTALYTQVSIRQLKSVHSLTHPGAKLERPATAAMKTEPSPTPTETVIELHAALDAEGADEIEAGAPG
jgi:integrase/recombinase XerD